MNATLLIALTLLFLYPGQVLAERILNGRLLLEDEQGALLPAADVSIKREATGISVRSDEQGRFRIPLREPDKPGAILRLLVNKAGWVVHLPLEGEVRIPADPEESVDIRLLPIGSERLWTEAHVEDLIGDLLFAAKGQAVHDGELRGLDFSAPIQDWATRYGFEPDQVQARLERWADEAGKAQDDPYKRGLAALATKKLGLARELFAESAGDGGRRLELARRERSRKTDVLRERMVRDFRLAGDTAYADFRFADARSYYRSSLALLNRTGQPDVAASVLHDLAAANYELGIRALSEDAQRHLTETVDALQSALTIQTLKTAPLEWTQTQSMLVMVYEELGDAAGMAMAIGALRTAEPDNRDYYKLSHALNHEVLFDFQGAHGETLSWLKRYPDDLDALCNLAETHFTTGEFEQAGAHLELLIGSGQLTPEVEAAMRLVEIASLLAQDRAAVVPARLTELRARLQAQPENFTVGWAFEGSSHFIGQEAAMKDYRGILFGLLWAAETGKRDALLTAIDKASSELSPGAGPHPE